MAVLRELKGSATGIRDGLVNKSPSLGDHIHGPCMASGGCVKIQRELKADLWQLSRHEWQWLLRQVDHCFAVIVYLFRSFETGLYLAHAGPEFQIILPLPLSC